MKIIDERGRLFGRINVIDFLVILFLLALVPMFYFGYKIFSKTSVVVEVVPEKEFIETEVNCRLIKLKPEIAGGISVGDQELDRNGQVIGEVLSLGEITPYRYNFNIGAEKPLTKEAPELKQILARLKLRAEIRQNNLYYKDKRIAVNSPLDFKAGKYNLIAVPEAKKIEKIEERIINLYVTLEDLDGDTLKTISQGDKEVDENGKVIAEILNLGKIENSSLELDLGNGNFVKGEDSSKKQISVKMRLRSEVRNGNQFYFKGKKVEYNTVLEFKTDKYKVNGRIAKTFETISPIKEKWMSLQVKFSGVVPEIASVVQKGDREKNAFEKTIAKIASIIANKPSQVLTLKEDQFITLNHPFNKDILASLDVLSVEKKGIYYFKNYPVKMGNNIVFSTDLYSVSGTIIGLEIK